MTKDTTFSTFNTALAILPTSEPTCATCKWYQPYLLTDKGMCRVPLPPMIANDRDYSSVETDWTLPESYCVLHTPS